MPLIAPRDPFVLLENSLDTGPEARSFLFRDPRRILRCDAGTDIMPALNEIQAAVDAGHYAAGWIAYEAGYWLESRLAPLRGRTPAPQPFLWFGIFDAPEVMGPEELDRYWQQRRSGCQEYAVADIRLSLSESDYLARLDAIHEYLAAGDIYQANFTLQCRFRLDGNVEALHRALRETQRVPYGALVGMGDATILSYSPELFLQRRGRRLTSRPMKGTAPRGLTWGRDLAKRRHLKADPKSRAENLMIVDLIRNDIGRLAEIGSVRVRDLYKVEAYQTLLQMTSTVEAELTGAPDLPEIVRSLFPCGSVTGAPKIRAMEIIHELETTPRGVYTGAIGMITPARDFTFNVPIRTMTVDSDGHGTLGIGGGIVADSDPRAEYEECLLKGRFFTATRPRFDLIETMRAEDGEIPLLSAHLRRLKASAKYFGFRLPETAIRRAIDRMQAERTDRGAWRIRLLVSRTGNFALTAQPHQPETTPELPTVAWAIDRVQSDDPFLYHKTTNRRRYEAAFKAASAAGHADAVFRNEDGHVTETARANLFVETGGCLLTPPVTCGLLPGTYRAHVLARKEPRAVERVLTAADLAAADRIYLCNAVTGLRPVRLADAGPDDDRSWRADRS